MGFTKSILLFSITAGRFLVMFWFMFLKNSVFLEILGKCCLRWEANWDYGREELLENGNVWEEWEEASWWGPAECEDSEASRLEVNDFKFLRECSKCFFVILITSSWFIFFYFYEEFYFKSWAFRFVYWWEFEKLPKDILAWALLNEGGSSVTWDS